MQVDPTNIVAIMALFGIGVIGIIEFIKRILKTEGQAVVNFIIAAVISFGATAAYLAQIDSFSILALIVYGLIVFGESTGLYHVYAKKKD